MTPHFLVISVTHVCLLNALSKSETQMRMLLKHLKMPFMFQCHGDFFFIACDLNAFLITNSWRLFLFQLQPGSCRKMEHWLLKRLTGLWHRTEPHNFPSTALFVLGLGRSKRLLMLHIHLPPLLGIQVDYLLLYLFSALRLFIFTCATEHAWLFYKQIRADGDGD